MGIFGRMKTLMKANVNDLASKAENPERILTQLIADMKEQLTDAKLQVRNTMTDLKLLEKKLATEMQESKKWEKNAMSAVKAGQDELAREALARKQKHDDLAGEFQSSIETQKNNVEELKSAVQKLGKKIEEADRKKTSLIARSERVKAQNAMSTGNVANNTNAFDEFERNAAKIEDMEAEVEASAELADTLKGSDELDDKFLSLEADHGGDDALEALKKKMGMD